MSVADFVQQHPDEDRLVLANRIIAEDYDTAVKVIAKEIDHVRRASVKTTEVESFNAMMRAMNPAHTPSLHVDSDTGESHVTVQTPAATPTASLEPFMRLLRHSFALGNRVKVAWGQATIEQDQQRVAMLRSMMRGTRGLR